MIRLLLPIAALLCGIALLLLGTGLLNTLLALRGSAEQFSDQTLGLLGSAYFAGFILGTWLCPRLIRRMGHVRAFTFLAAAEAACVLIHLLWIQPGLRRPSAAARCLPAIWQSTSARWRWPSRC